MRGSTAARPDRCACLRTKSLIKQLHATGVQIYECQPAKNDPAQFEWVFRGPEANLLTKGGPNRRQALCGPDLGSQRRQPRGRGGRSATARARSPIRFPGCCCVRKATAGNGLFTHVQFIQRLNTVGGSVPATGCRKEQAGQQLRASYTADYLFYGARH